MKRATLQALEKLVFVIWNNDDLNPVLSKVFDKLKVVFCNILRGYGSNDLVEDHRGVEGRKIKIEKVLNELSKNTNDDVITNLTEDDVVDDDDDAQVQFI